MQSFKSNCILNISTWKLNRHLKLNMCTSESWFLPPKICSTHSLLILIPGNSTLAGAQPKHLELLFTCLFDLHTTSHPSTYTISTAFKIHLQLNCFLPSLPYRGLRHHHCCLLHCSSLLTDLLSHLCFIHSILDRALKQILWKLCHSSAQNTPGFPHFPQKKSQNAWSSLFASLTISYYSLSTVHAPAILLFQLYSNFRVSALDVPFARNTFPQILMWLNPSFFKTLFKFHLLKRLFPTSLICSMPLIQLYSFPQCFSSSNI